MCAALAGNRVLMMVGGIRLPDTFGTYIYSGRDQVDFAHSAQLKLHASPLLPSIGLMPWVV
ncbi:hypothetical protein C1H71_13055 [Iodobacter fluviatilis]|uniref:Uncharacterized protein n=1 Tax=Iodobacter fluviatilis TaxID=537 RepID=A0A7G3GB48_9NEIS|nr:hypothetical protein C1H71_13055 [Iodobacter fluviatilis]